MAIAITRQGNELSIRSPFGLDSHYVLMSQDSPTYCINCDADIEAGTPFWQGVASRMQDPTARCETCAQKHWKV